MPRIFSDTTPQPRDDHNTLLAKRLQFLGGQSRRGATDDEIEKEILKIPVFTQGQVNTLVDELSMATDAAQTQALIAQAALKAGESTAALGDIWVSRGTARPTAASPTGLWTSVAYGNGRFVAVAAASNRAFMSLNGVDWEYQANAGLNDAYMQEVTFGNGLFVAVGSGPTYGVMTSTDGVNWLPRIQAAVRVWSSVVYGNGRFVAVSLDPGASDTMWSLDGISWNAVTSGGTGAWRSVAFGEGKFVAVSNAGVGNQVISSADGGLTWAVNSGAVDNAWAGVTYGAGRFVAVSENGTNRVMTSEDGLTWVSQTSATGVLSYVWNGVGYGGGQFVAVAGGAGHHFMTSPDGINWTDRLSPDAQKGWESVVYGGGMFVVVGNSVKGWVGTSGTYGSDLIIPADRRIVWTGNVGIPNGIPNRTTIYHTFANGVGGFSTNGTSDMRSLIQAKIDACPADQVVLLPAGTIRVASRLDMKANITVRGAGMGLTTIKGTCSGGNVVEGVFSFNAGLSVSSSSSRAILTGAIKGSTEIVLASADSRILVGDVIFIDQLDPVDRSFIDGRDRHDNTSRTVAPDRHNSQLVKVTAVAGAAITFEPPLVWTFSNSPETFTKWRNGATNYLFSSGVEDLTVEYVNPTSAPYQHCVLFKHAAHCWLKNVKLWKAWTAHIECDHCYRLEIRGCTLQETANTANSYGYGISVNYQTCFSLIEDNILDRTRDGIKVNGGAAGNVIIYNYHINQLQSGASTQVIFSGGAHNSHPMMNLFEGNVTYVLGFDYTFGSSSHQTLLRNWLRGPMPWANNSNGASYGSALVLNMKATSYNVVGNVLGSTVQQASSNWSARFHTKIRPTTFNSGTYTSFRVGYYGEASNDSNYPWNAVTQWANTIAAGNYDYVVSNQVWDNPTTPVTIPDSYFYTSKPAYFGSLAWPPIDPAGPTVGEQVIPAGYRYANGGANPPP